MTKEAIPRVRCHRVVVFCRVSRELAGLIERVVSGGMVGDVVDGRDFGDGLPHHPLHTLLQRHPGEGASLAASGHLDEDLACPFTSTRTISPPWAERPGSPGRPGPL